MSRGPSTVGFAALRSRELLESTATESPGREADLIVGLVKGWSETTVLAHPDEPLSRYEEERIQSLVHRRAAGEPFAYLAGVREFYGRTFAVDSRVLIPRPETEHLVESALARSEKATRILDVCTGSGCVAVTLAAELPQARVVATDISVAALAVARENAKGNGVDQRVTALAQDLVTALDLREFHLVVANPPYVANEDREELPRDIREHEPPQALLAGENGLELVRGLLQGLEGLSPGTPLLMEIGIGQLNRVRALASNSGFRFLAAVEDLSGIPRIVELEREAG